MSLGRGLAWLAVSVAVTLAGAGGVAWSNHGLAGLKAAIVAAFVCWCSAGLALASLLWWKKQNLPIQGALSGMGIRTFLSLGAGAWLSSRGGELAEAGVFGLIVVFYLVTLVVDTILSVKIINPRGAEPVSRHVNPG